MMSREHAEESCDEDTLFADGFDEAIIGISHGVRGAIIVYDAYKCIDILAQSMSYEEAEEFFSYNVIGSYVGEKTPIFCYTSLE